MQPESAAFLWDVREAGVRITTFTEGLTGESYAADELRKSAVERQLEIIGEAPLPTQNVLVAQGSFELQIARPSNSPVGHIRVGWFEESGTGSSVSWSNTGGTDHELAAGVHDLDVPSESLMLVGSPGEYGKIVVAWHLSE